MKIEIFAILFALGLSACSNDANHYNTGYKAAWNGEEKPSSVWSTKQQIDGYQDGLDDADMYDEGYYDGKNKNKPKYFNDLFYMDGFKDGKKQR